MHVLAKNSGASLDGPFHECPSTPQRSLTWHRLKSKKYIAISLVLKQPPTKESPVHEHIHHTLLPAHIVAAELMVRTRDMARVGLASRLEHPNCHVDGTACRPTKFNVEIILQAQSYVDYTQWNQGGKPNWPYTLFKPHVQVYVVLVFCGVILM